MNKGDRIVIETAENLLTNLEEHSRGRNLDLNEYGAGTFIISPYFGHGSTSTILCFFSREGNFIVLIFCGVLCFTSLDT